MIRRWAAPMGLLALGCGLWGQTMPAPTGLHRVGRASFYWTDSKRAELAAETPGGRRRIAVHAWYPGAPEGGVPAPYLPSAGRLLASTAAGALSNLFGPSWPAIISNQVRTHAFEKLAVKSGARLPVLVFSPGAGAPVAAYTAQLEELASHGYVVMGVEHTYEAPGVVFPDGRVVGVAREYWERLRRESAGEEEFEKRVTEMRAADLVFVVEQLARDGEAIFRRRLDVGRIGVFGHSRGGRAAALACQMERRIRACANQDGSMQWQPYWLDGKGRGVRQPFLMLDHLDPELPEEVFVRMGTTRAEYAARRAARQAEAREKLYETVAGGSYQITIRTPGVSHNSFMDARLLGRADGGNINGWPKEVQARTPHERILREAAGFTRAFFDRHLREFRGTLRELAGVPEADVEIRRFAGSRE